METENKCTVCGKEAHPDSCLCDNCWELDSRFDLHLWIKIADWHGYVLDASIKQE